MTKGIEMICQHCGKGQDVTEVAAHDVLGVSYWDAKKFIAQYRELVDPRKHYAQRIRAYQDTGVIMLGLLKRIANCHAPCCDLMEEVKEFVKQFDPTH